MSSERWSCTVKLEYAVGKNNEKASNNSWGSKIIKTGNVMEGVNGQMNTAMDKLMI